MAAQSASLFTSHTAPWTLEHVRGAVRHTLKTFAVREAPVMLGTINQSAASEARTGETRTLDFEDFERSFIEKLAHGHLLELGKPAGRR